MNTFVDIVCVVGGFWFVGSLFLAMFSFHVAEDSFSAYESFLAELEAKEKTSTLPQDKESNERNDDQIS